MPRRLPLSLSSERLFRSRERIETDGAVRARALRPGGDRGEVAAGLGRRGVVHVPNPDPAAPDTRPSTYVLEMLPYPSGELHMGHTLNYTIGDVLTHIRRRQGHARCCGRWATTRSACRRRTPRSTRAGTRARSPSATSSRSASRCSAWAGRSTGRARSRPPTRSTTAGHQWLFLRFFEKGLAYRKEAPVNWCPNDQTVLANEQVIDGRCERCGAEVESREPDAVVLPDHRLRRRAARRDRPLEDWPERC